MASEDTVTLTSSCLCKAHIFKTTVPRSSLPLTASACHCNSCRHLTGALYSIDAPWPEPTANVDTSGLKAFSFSERHNVLFCATCSTPIFWAHPQTPNAPLGVFTGTLQNDHADLVKIKHHIYVGDTLDGGATPWLRNPNANGPNPNRYLACDSGPQAQELDEDWPPTPSLTGYSARTQSALPIRCKCKGIDMVLHEGAYAGRPRADIPWPIDPETHKNVAGPCVCDSCRLQGGIDFFFWTFAELGTVAFADGRRFPGTQAELRALVDAGDAAVGTLEYYASSTGVQRYFCGTCSACVFYACDDRPSLVDVAVGLLEAEDGARAEGFLSWAFGEKGSHGQDVKGGWREVLVENAVKDSEQWRIARGYPKNWRRVAREEADAKNSAD